MLLALYNGPVGFYDIRMDCINFLLLWRTQAMVIHQWQMTSISKNLVLPVSFRLSFPLIPRTTIPRDYDRLGWYSLGFLCCWTVVHIEWVELCSTSTIMDTSKEHCLNNRSEALEALLYVSIFHPHHHDVLWWRLFHFINLKERDSKEETSNNRQWSQ